MLHLDLHNLPTTKALGLYWNLETDAFEVKVNVQHKPLTRRGILSVISQIYDVLGVVQPFILPARILLQKAGYDQIPWDEPVRDCLRN